MIGFLPRFYSDELLYSLFARYAVRSGYLTYRSAAEDIYLYPLKKPNIEFINPLTDDLIATLTIDLPLSEIVLKHTMFPYYARFLPYMRMKSAFDAALTMNSKDLYNLLPLPKNRPVSVLRFCPICAYEDRQANNETYWHRSHQLFGIDVCAKHGCYLINTDVSLKSKSKPASVTAEEVVPDNSEKIFTHNKLEQTIARYVNDVFQSELQFDNPTTTGEYLQSRLIGTPYLSRRSKARNITLMQKDFIAYYQSINLCDFSEIWQIQKVFTNYRYNPFEICLFALFLGVTAEELAHMEITFTEPNNRFDEQIKALHNKGYNYRQIAIKMNASYDVVKKIGSGQYFEKQVRKPKDKITKLGRTPKGWNVIDNQTLSAVKELITRLNGVNGDKPIKVTYGTVERLLGLPSRSIDKLSRCKAYISKHIEPQERYWARLVAWRAKQLSKQEITYSSICKYINIRRENFNACLRYLTDFIEKDIADMIKGL